MRRRTLISAAAAAAVCALSPTVSALETESQQTESVFDVVVAGSGLAGLAAALAARESGARSVLILEKGPLVGGHSVFASGSMTFIDPKRQLEGVTDTVDDFVEDARFVGGDINEAMVRLIGENSGEAIDWLESYGIRFSPIPFRAFGGMKARCISAMSNFGAKQYVTRLHEAAKRSGIQIRLLEPVCDLLREGDYWKVTTHPSGRAYSTVYAKSVVLATGGFTANVAMRMKYDARLDSSLSTTANPQGHFYDGADGDGHRMAFKLGAAAVKMQNIIVMPYWNGRLLDYAGGEIYVDSLGARFVDETSSHRTISEKILALPDRAFWVITDSKTHKGANFGTKLAMGGIHKSESIGEMAAEMGMPLKSLQKTIDEFNAAVRSGNDPKFGRTLFLQTLDTPPFYWGKETLFVHGTLGGVKTDLDCRVLTEDDEPIAGLYAAGEIVGGVWGKDRMGGCALTACVVQGRLAGRSAANP